MAKQHKRFKPKARYGEASPGPIVIDTSAGEQDVETEVLFTIDGDEYTVPKVVPAIVGVRALEVAATEGEAASVRWLMLEVLGQEAYDALLACTGVTSKQLGQIMTVVRDKAMGDMEDALGN